MMELNDGKQRFWASIEILLFALLPNRRKCFHAFDKQQKVGAKMSPECHVSRQMNKAKDAKNLFIILHDNVK